MAEPTQYQIDYARGVAAKRAGLPFDQYETPGFEIGFGDAVLIEPMPDGEEPPE